MSLSEIARGAASALASGDEAALRNRLREIDESLATHLPAEARVTRLTRATEGSYWREIFDKNLRPSLPMTESAGTKSFAVLASEFAPADSERYRTDVAASAQALLDGYRTVLSECESLMESRALRAPNAETGYAHGHLDTLVGAFLHSLVKTTKSVLADASVVLSEESESGDLPSLAKFHDFLADTLEDSRAATTFAKSL